MQLIKNNISTTDKLVQNERRGIWLALIVVLVLASTLVLGSDTRRALLTGMAVAIVFAVGWLTQSRTRSMRRQKQDAVLQDELRQLALARAYRAAFFIVLAALVSFCTLRSVVGFDLSSQLLAALVVALGVSTFLALFLLFDRG